MRPALFVFSLFAASCSSPCPSLPDAAPDQARTQIDCSCSAADSVAQKACDLNCLGAPSICVEGFAADGGAVYGCAAP